MTGLDPNRLADPLQKLEHSSHRFVVSRRWLAESGLEVRAVLLEWAVAGTGDHGICPLDTSQLTNDVSVRRRVGEREVEQRG